MWGACLNSNIERAGVNPAYNCPVSLNMPTCIEQQNAKTITKSHPFLLPIEFISLKNDSAVVRWNKYLHLKWAKSPSIPQLKFGESSKMEAEEYGILHWRVSNHTEPNQRLQTGKFPLTSNAFVSAEHIWLQFSKTFSNPIINQKSI